MIATDILQTVFQVSGVAAVIGALNNVERAQDRLTQAQARFIAGRGSLDAVIAAQRGLAITTFQSAMVGAQQAFGALQRLDQAVQGAVDRYADFGRKVREVMQITGSSAQEAAYAVNLGRAAGIPDTRELQEILRVAKGFTLGGTGSSQAGALLRLGIGDSARGGVETLNQVLNRLGALRDGFYKTALEEQLFGVRGAVALQDLLALTAEQREQVLQLSNAFEGSGVAAVQRYQASVAILGMTIEQRLVFPLAEKFLPILQRIVGWVSVAVDKFIALDRWTHGLAGAAVVLAGMAAAAGLLAVGIANVIVALRSAVTVLRSFALVQAFITALSGPVGLAKVLAAGAVTGVVAYGGYRLLNGAGEAANRATDANTAATNRNTQALTNLFDNLGQFGGLPRGLAETDVMALQRAAGLGAIG